jgi:hypothetical protein
LAGLAGSGIVLASALSWSLIPFVSLMTVLLGLPIAIPGWFPLIPTTQRRVLRDRLFLGGMMGAYAIGAWWLVFGFGNGAL